VPKVLKPIEAIARRRENQEEAQDSISSHLLKHQRERKFRNLKITEMPQLGLEEIA
jgi:hypothetical protein